jgi:hypothetical protein
MNLFWCPISAMKPPVTVFLITLICAYVVSFTGLADASETQAGNIHINHDGTMQSSAQGMSLHGIGTSHISTENFKVSVRGQFRMLSSAKLISQGRKLAEVCPIAKPVWVSLVALGEIQLEIKGKDGDPSTFHQAKTAVYHVRDNRWVLDSKEIMPL